MLTSLTIRNYALVDELSADFSKGLMVLTGETGAGKSIIVGALGVLLGDRSGPGVIRTGATKAVIEGTFAVSGNKDISRLIRTNDLDGSDHLVLRREITASGQNRCFLNDTPVSLSLLREAGDLLVDIHGQHEHQSLLRPATHISYLDSYASVRSEASAYSESLTHLRTLLAERADLMKRNEELTGKLELYRFHLQEIDGVDPDPGEEETLQGELRILENAEKIAAAAAEVSDLLYEGDNAAVDLLARTRDRLELLAGYDPQFSSALALFYPARAIIEELARGLRDYASGIDYSPERVEEVRERLGRLSMLRKKFGGSLDSVLEYRNTIAAELRQSETFDATIDRLSLDIHEAQARCGDCAAALSKKRHDAAASLTPLIIRGLKSLGMPGSQFQVDLALEEAPADQDGDSGDVIVRKGKRVRLTEHGFDRVEFLVSANVGEPPRPLARIASGGEISRIMLVLKSILAKQDRLPVVVFDEIDAGVSGRIAEAVGRSLKRLSAGTQVIVITHLPQIAGLADEHYAVLKRSDGSRTMTALQMLKAEERVREVARLLSGAKVTDAAIEGARELIKTS